MPAYSFTEIPDAEDFSPIPPGHYRAHYEHKETSHEYGHEKWTYNMVIDEGPHAGRRIKDSITWIQRPQNDKEMKIAQRLKLVLHRLGFDVDQPGPVDYQPKHLEGCVSVIEVINKEQEDPSTGRVKIFNNIPFAGYERPSMHSAKVKSAQQPPAAAAPSTAPPIPATSQPAIPSAPATVGRPSHASEPPAGVNPPGFSLDDLPF